MVNTGRGRRTGVFCRFCGHQDNLIYCSQWGLPSARSVSTSRPKTFVEIVGSKEPATFTVVATRAVMFLFLAGVMSITAPAVGAEVADVPEGHGSALVRPGEKCKVLPLSEWIKSEKWAWTEICEARVANFNERPGADLFDPRDVKDVENLSDRKLRSSFLETILLHEPYRSSIPRQGVRIIEAYFPNRIDLSDASIHRPLILEQSRFDSNVELSRLTTSTYISFQGSIIKGKLDMKFATVEGHLLMGKDAEFDAVYLTAAKIGGDINMRGETEYDFVAMLAGELGSWEKLSGPKFKGELNMNSATVGGDLLMREGAEFDEISLTAAKIGGDIDIHDSKIKGKLNMNSVSVEGFLHMSDESKFDEVSLVGAKIGGRIEMKYSTFKGELNMNSATVEGLLLMGGSEFKDVDLSSAKFGDTLSIIRSKFAGQLNIISATVEGLLLMGGSEFKDVDLSSAKFGDTLSIIRSKFAGQLNIISATVGGHLLMKEGAEFDVVYLTAAKIGGDIDMSGSEFKGLLNMNSATVGSHLLMREGAEFDVVYLQSAKIGGDVNMWGSIFKGELKMDSATVKGHFIIERASFENSAFENLAIISLRHTNVGTLQDDKYVWPNSLNLDGFTYERLGGPDGSDQADPFERGSGWFEKWLEKNEPYSRQPYRHLASVLQAAGHEDMADDILVASRDREWEESSMSEGKWWRLALLKYFIGYGYGNGNFLALIWALALVAVGTFVLHCTKEHKKHDEFHNPLDTICYSLDVLLPIIRLRERHYNNVDLETGARYYFYFHKVMGYVIMFFAIAGLSGLTS